MTSDNAEAAASENREFDVHLHVLEHGNVSAAPCYTIGIWERSGKTAGLRAICHMRPLREALPAIAKEFYKRAQPQSFDIKYPKWSEIAELVKHLHAHGVSDSGSAADILQAVFMSKSEPNKCRSPARTMAYLETVRTRIIKGQV